MPFKKGKSGNPKGWPKGQKRAKTLEREAEERAFRQIIMEHCRAMTATQVENAQGTKYLVKREKSGKFVRLTPETLDQCLAGGGEEIIEVYDKDPSIQAYTDLMNRAFGKPAEKVELEHSGEVKVYTWEK